MADNTITINMDEKCPECRQPGRCGNGLCLGCTSKALQRKPMKSAVGRAVQNAILDRMKRLTP